MNYTYLEVDPPLCYLLYRNYLVINVPRKQLDDCVEKLENKETIKYNNFIKVFQLNRFLKLTFEHERRIFSLSDGLTDHTEILLDANMRTAIADWLGQQLLKRHFKSQKQYIPDRIHIKQGLAWMLGLVVVVVALDYLAWTGIKSGSQHVLCRMVNFAGPASIYIGGACILAAMLLWTAHKVKRGALQTVYKYK